MPSMGKKAMVVGILGAAAFILLQPNSPPLNMKLGGDNAIAVHAILAGLFVGSIYYFIYHEYYKNHTHHHHVAPPPTPTPTPTPQNVGMDTGMGMGGGGMMMR